ncbi:MAG: magnesium transporter MgtE N-terminal domain-containing protein [Acidimicrobiales bacterium]
MARRPSSNPIRSPLPSPGALRDRRRKRVEGRDHNRRFADRRAVAEAITSLAGIIGRPVRLEDGSEVGRMVDVVARWSNDNPYPPVTGLLVRVARRLVFIDAECVSHLAHAETVLSSAHLDMRDFVRRPGEVLLAKDVLDHQLVDVDGVQVIRPSDLFLAPALGRLRLVGADVSVQSLLRRLGPVRWRPRPTFERFIDWAAIQPFGDGNSEVRLRISHEGLHHLRPGELADLLEDLGRPARQELLAALEPEAAADALEEMDPGELETLLREAAPDQAARLLSSMEPDEATDALRDLGRDDRDEILGLMEPETALRLKGLLGFSEDQAGGIMTTNVALARLEETVDDLRRRLSAPGQDRSDIDAVALIDDEGSLVWDLAIVEAFVAEGTTRLRELAGSADPVTVSSSADLGEVAVQLIEARRSSVLVVDERGAPIGRILADDVVDALSPDRGRFHFPRLLQ